MFNNERDLFKQNTNKKSKPGIEYPFIQLSKEYLHLVGENVIIYEVSHDNSPSFLIKTDNGVEQPESHIDIPGRLAKIEAELNDLKNL